VLASPLVIVSALAARTRRIRIGQAVQVLPLTNPLRVVEEAATVDQISQGRFDFGVGRSGLTRYYSPGSPTHGTDPPRQSAGSPSAHRPV
jgi:alkanesulfonate monooxygenase SsuD/methylene tetrahydromethanopterin reductase-like flavin-dependent oxidoreductase (luciferase family)